MPEPAPAGTDALTGGPTSRHGRRYRRARVGLGLALAPLVLAACSTSSSEGPTTTAPPTSPTPSAADPTAFQVRPVLAVSSDAGACPARNVPPEQPGWFCDDTATARYRLDRAVLTGADVATADAGLPINSDSWAVSIDLDPAGTQAFAQLTTRVVDEQQPHNQVAVVFDGTVVSAPVIESPITLGQLQVTGSFTQEQAQQLAAQLQAAATTAP